MNGTIIRGLKRLGFCFVAAVFAVPAAWAMEVNEDGRTLILEAEQAYRSDMDNRALVTDRAITGYAEKIVKALVPPGKKPPAGVKLGVSVLDAPQPELYAYTNGEIVMTTGVLYAMENEAQLAGVLSREVANVVEGYYIGMYQQIKAAERSERNKAAAGALLGALFDVAVEYAVDMEGIRRDEAFMSGEATYGETMRKMAAVEAARSGYYGIKDVAENVPAKDADGNWVDPRLRFDAIADAQGMEYTALAGYDCRETAKGWSHLYRIKSDMLKQQEQAMGQMAAQLRDMQALMGISMKRMQASLGASGLVQTRSDVPAKRAEFVATLVKLQEVQEAQKQHKPAKKAESYRAFLNNSVVKTAQKAMEAEEYEKAHAAFKALWEKGIRTAQVAYGMARCKLGDFAFGASEADKEEAEKAYKEAARLDPKYALAYRGLGELYNDWDRYADAAKAYRTYIKLAPKAKDKGRIERKIKLLERKASR